jgi:hypothetical protein
MSLVAVRKGIVRMKIRSMGRSNSELLKGKAVGTEDEKKTNKLDVGVDVGAVRWSGPSV